MNNAPSLAEDITTATTTEDAVLQVSHLLHMIGRVLRVLSPSGVNEPCTSVRYELQGTIVNIHQEQLSVIGTEKQYSTHGSN
jgi:hypothetical protein